MEHKKPHPFGMNFHTSDQGMKNEDWWKDRLNLDILAKNPDQKNPMDDGFDYRKEYEKLDIDAVRKDIDALLTESQDWWPADFGNYGPFFVRMAWHAAGTYRVQDGRGGAGTGQQRFAPLNSWPDNVLLDRARRLLWPIKQKYGKSLSWADLIVLAGTEAQSQMGLPIVGFGGGRPDVWEPDDDVYWGSETAWLGDDKRIQEKDGKRELDPSVSATEMGLIYVNPEGPAANSDPISAAHDIRVTFGRMGMNDEETVALIAGGHTFGKGHGAAPGEQAGPSPEDAPMEDQGIGWKQTYGSGKGTDTIGSGLEVTWTYHPTRWDNEFLHILFAYEWELMTGPSGHKFWRPKNGAGSDMVPEADLKGKREPRMLTTDLSLREDPAYREIALRFRDDQDAFTEAYAKAWYKLTHRDLGPKSRLLGKYVPKEDFLWQDPLPERDYALIDDEDVAQLKEKIAQSGLEDAEMVKLAWAAASSFRGSDFRGGVNGARIRLAPQKDFAVNQPEKLAGWIEKLESIQSAFNAENTEKRVSLADLIVLAGNVGVENAAKKAGMPVKVPFVAGRVDAAQEQTDVVTDSYLEPFADGFRNYVGPFADPKRAEYLLVDKANLLTLTAPEMTVLVGGLREIGANWDDSDLGVLTEQKGALTTDFFRNLLDIRYQWKSVDEEKGLFEATDRKTGEVKWKATRADLVFSSNSELRALAEVYGADDAKEKFVHDFVAAWVKVMELDRFDLKK